ncbi:homocysteine S-methyltransferase family protein [Xanthobacter sp. KR7-65]|uniref:homocysteine S-methyltransferase family protein n=1 Tax=Xanthobacter sp. KR7-65 TaxID=3156612 RepID=UPI0032B5C5B4
MAPTALPVSGPVLADGAIETRLIYEFRLPTPDFAAFVHLFTPEGRAALEAIYRGYMSVAAESGLAMQVGTPTWRAHPEGLARQGFDAPEDLARVNGAAFDLLSGLRRELALEASVRIAGVIGPRRDGYDPAGAPDAAEAARYHAAQAQVLADLGVDLLYAPTFASAGELEGVARAAAATGRPYALAPVVDAAGVMPDGTPLAAAVAHIDASVAPRPLHFLLGCVHPARVDAVAQAGAMPPNARIAGVKANAADLAAAELDHLDHLVSDPPEDFARAMVSLRGHGLRLFGGCCGTSDAHIRALARHLKAEAA